MAKQRRVSELAFVLLAATICGCSGSTRDFEGPCDATGAAGCGISREVPQGAPEEPIVSDSASLMQVSIHERAVRESPLGQVQEDDTALVQRAQERELDSSLVGKDKDCEMHGWGHWSACSTSCGYGTKSRSRGIKQHKEGNGRSCGSTSETVHCKLRECPIHCTLSGWAEWTTCSATCGDGTRTRERSVTVDAQHGGRACEGALEASEGCKDKECPVHCELSDWTRWSACSTTCGQGTRSRSRSVSVAARHGGQACEDALEASEACKDRECPVHCILSGWSDWAACSKTCCGGTRSRSRSVTTPAQHGGVACDEAERVLQVVLGPEAPTADEWGDDGVSYMGVNIKNEARCGQNRQKLGSGKNSEECAALASGAQEANCLAKPVVAYSLGQGIHAGECWAETDVDSKLVDSWKACKSQPPCANPECTVGSGWVNDAGFDFFFLEEEE